jgi:hypothetical protein
MNGYYVFGGIAGIIVIAVIAYYLARAMKGSMKIGLSQKAFRAGDKITGRLEVTVKKTIFADRLYIGLVGEREERRRSHGGRKDSTRWVEFFRNEVDLLSGKQLPAGFRETYEFQLDTPSESQVMTAAGALGKAAAAMPDGTAKTILAGIGSVAEVAGSWLGDRRRWKVISRLETKGVDLAASERIQVSLK